VKRSLFVSAIVFLVVLAACQAPAPQGSTSKVGGQWVISATEEPDTLDPHKSTTALSDTILRYVGDPLIAKDQSGKYVPGLAKSWTISPDGLTWTFQLRDGVKFHDGTPFDAAAMKATFDRALDPATKSPIAGGLLGPVKSVATTDKSTLVLTLNQPFSPLLDNLSDAGRMLPLSPKAMNDADFGRKPISTGPWKVAEWRSGDRIVLARNPDYAWAADFLHKGAAFIDTIVFRIIPESATQVSAFESGEVDQLGVPPAQVQRYLDEKRFDVKKAYRNGVGLFLEFNVTKAPFDDLALRRALNYAVDKDAVVKTALKGFGEAAYGPLPPSIRGYFPGIVQYAPHFDKAKAAEALDQAGWKLEGGVRMKSGLPLTFTLYNAAIDTWKDSAQLVQAQLKDLGIDMKIQTFEFGTLLAKAKQGEQQAHFLGYTYTNPDIVYIWFHSSNIGTGLNVSHYKDAALDKMIEDARLEVDDAKRLKLYENIQKYIVDKALWVPIWTNYIYTAYQPRGKDVKLDSEGRTILFDAYVQ
jgi:peptide/nickel transport system substrate-binding protein